MAAQTHPGSFVLEVADLGERLTTAYTSFIVYRKAGDQRLENLYCTLAVTTSKLRELGTTLNKYEQVIIKDHVTRPLVEKCKENFDKFLQLMNEGNAKGVWKNDGKAGGRAITTEIDPWFLITMGLGGREETKAFWNCLDDTRNSLIELNDVVKYIVLKSLANANNLDSQNAQEYAKMKELLPHLVESVEKGAQIRREDAAREADRLRRQQSRARSPFAPGLRRRCSTASSDVTLPVEARHPPSFYDELPKDRGRSRSRSISSFSSVSSANSPARGPAGPEVIYEEWILRWNEPLRNLQRSSSFLGFKVKHYFENPGFWGTDPEYRSQEEMKEQEKFASADLSPAKHKEAMAKAIQAIPKKGGVCIDVLLEERSEASNADAKRVWSVVAVRPKQKFVYSSKKSWGKDRKTTDWLITIKGETIDTLERKRHLRWQNPFPDRRDRNRSRSYSPYPSRHGRARPLPRPRAISPYVIRNEHPLPIRRARRAMSPMRPLPIRRRSPPRPVVIRPRNASPFDEAGEYRVGNVVVGKILTVEEAEQKMDEIWAEMNVEKKEEKEDEPEIIGVAA